MFSRTLGAPQPDWPRQTVQTGFCFYDGQKDTGQMPQGLQEFLDAGEPPIVFTLGSAAVMDARDFYEVSAAAAARLNKRAVLIYGIFNQPPGGLTDDIRAFDYAPFSLVFPRAACVVHQGGVGTTGQVLRAGVPQLVVPFAHDQPDNAARCVRLGVAETIARFDYNVDSACKALGKLLSASSYKTRAFEAAAIVAGEGGTSAACDAIERILVK